MELKIKPYHKNIFPAAGILIRGDDPSKWISEIQRMGLKIEELSTFAIPGLTANSVWGCFVAVNSSKRSLDAGINEYCRGINNILFIPEKCIIYPAVSEVELGKLLMGNKHILHPEFGLAELNEEIKWNELLEDPTGKTDVLIVPRASVFIPKTINSFQVAPVPAEEILQEIEGSFPKPEKMENKPLNPFEKAKLWFYKQMFNKKDGDKDKQKNGEGAGKPAIEQTPAMGFLNKIMNFFSKQENKIADKMMTDFEELEKRNQKQIDRLMDMLKNNPEEALKYAIPLDNDGSNRGGIEGTFDLSKRWLDFSLLGPMGSGGGGSVVMGDKFQELRNQYMKTAEELIKKQEHRKAAFIYMKLLKNNYQAAATLENGHLYPEAASVYLKFVQNKNKAAECFEKGHMTTEAIDLYKELQQNEKVGDLYMSIYMKKEAFGFFEKVADDYKSKDQYVKASLMYKTKMDNPSAGQSMLLEGWRKNKDAFNCLNNYLNNIKDVKSVGEEINHLYSKEVDNNNRENFLKVIEYEYEKHEELSEPIRDMAYEIITEEIRKNPAIVNELKVFNKSNKELSKDTARFRARPQTAGKDNDGEDDLTPSGKGC
jgi:hypothetical protein